MSGNYTVEVFDVINCGAVLDKLSYAEALKTARTFRDGYCRMVKLISPKGKVLKAWKRDMNGDGKRWYRVEV